MDLFNLFVACILALSLQVFRSRSDFDWARIQAREDIGKQFELLFPSCLTRMFEMTAAADQMAARLTRQPSVKEVADMWASRVKQSSMSEKVSATYIDTVMTVRKRILSCADCLRLLLEADDEFGAHSPWQSVYTMEVVAKKVGMHGCVDRLVWIIATINHEMRAGLLDKASMSMRNFSGKGHPNNKGYCDMVLYKYDLKAHMLAQELPKLGIPAEEAKQVFARLENHAAHDASTKGGKAWIGIMSETAQLFFNFVASAVYGQVHDQGINTDMRHGKSIAEVVEEAPLLGPWAEVKKAAEHQAFMLKGPADAEPKDSGSQSAAVRPVAEESHRIALGHFLGVDMGNVVSDESVQIAETIKKMSCDDEQILTAYEKKALDRVEQSVEILVGKDSIASMAADLRSTEFGKLRATDADGDVQVVVIFYRQQLASEYATQTQQRTPPLRRDGACGGHYKCMIQAVLQSRLPAEDEGCGRFIHDGDCFVVGDGGKDGNASTLLSVFFSDEDGKALAKQSKKLTVFFDEAQISKRRDAAPRSGLTLDQSESFYYITAGTLKAPKRQRLNFEHATTAGTILGPCELPEDDDKATWKMPIGEKKKLYGAARLLPGGPVPQPAEPLPKGAPKPRARTDATIEPVTFFGLTMATCEELVHQAGNIKSPKAVKCVIDLTPMDGTMGTMCLETGIPYLAIALTEFHRTCLLQRLAQTVFNSFLSPISGLHVPALCNILAPTDDKPTVELAEELKGKSKKTVEDKRSETVEGEGADDAANDAIGKKKKTSVDKKKPQGSVKDARERLLARLQGASAVAAGAGEADDEDGGYEEP